MKILTTPFEGIHTLSGQPFHTQSTRQPSGQPTRQPSGQPTGQPSSQQEYDLQYDGHDAVLSVEYDLPTGAMGIDIQLTGQLPAACVLFVMNTIMVAYYCYMLYSTSVDHQSTNVYMCIGMYVCVVCCTCDYSKHMLAK